MNKDKRGLAMLISGILRRVRNGQCTAMDSIYLASFLQDLLIQTGNSQISDFIIDRTFDRQEREAMQKFYSSYEGIL